MPDTGVQMRGGVNKRASSVFPSWIQPINMYAGSHESFRSGLVAVFYVLRDGLTDSEMLASTSKAREEPKALLKLGKKNPQTIKHGICCLT